MTTVNGLPAHVLLVHFVVVLAPLTAVLAALCAIWPAARRRLVWLVLALAAACVVLTPLTAEAGEWLTGRVDASRSLQAHVALGDSMIYFSAALLVAAVLLAIIHVRAEGGKALNPIAVVVVSIFVLVAAVSTTVQVYRIGDSGAQAVWAGESEGD